jgi:hypothetical protein
VLEQVVLSALDGAACRRDVSREDLVLALADEQSLEAFAAKHGISTADAEDAAREGPARTVDDAEKPGRSTSASPSSSAAASNGSRLASRRDKAGRRRPRELGPEWPIVANFANQQRPAARRRRRRVGFSATKAESAHRGH